MISHNNQYILIFY